MHGTLQDRLRPREHVLVLVLVFVHDRQQLGASADTAHLFINVLASMSMRPPMPMGNAPYFFRIGV